MIFKKNKFEVFMLSNLSTNLAVLIVIKTYDISNKDRHIDQLSGMESSKINIFAYCQLIFDNDAMTI
jgi:hypothetical protein